MKKIGIDARLYFQTGVGTYLQNLLFYLQKINPREIRFYIYVQKKDATKINFKNQNFILRQVEHPWHSINEQIGFLKTLNDENLDLMHFTYFSYPILYRRSYLSTVHDLTPLYFKTGKASTKNPLLYEFKHLIFRYVLKNQIFNSKIIITPSQNVKKQIINEFGEGFKQKIRVIYEGINKKLIEAKENLDLKNRFRQPFFIYVGNFYPHKNITSLIKAFLQTNINASLLLVGPNDYFARQLNLQINKADGRIILYTTSSLGDLKFLYKHAIALIHPSVSEGFGLPLVEAAYFNCPIIASNIAVFNELLGEKYVNFNPGDINDIRQKITDFYNSSNKSKYVPEVGKYSFKEMAKKTLDQYLKNL